MTLDNADGRNAHGATDLGHADRSSGQAGTPSHAASNAEIHHPAQSETQTAPVSIGGPGHDHFVLNAPDDADSNHWKWTNASSGVASSANVSTPAALIGGPADDHFVFAPATAGDANSNSTPHQESFEHLPNAQEVQELHALMGSEVHGDMPIYHGPDGAGVPDVHDQLQHIIQAGHVLLH